MKIDLTQQECDLITATLIATIDDYENMKQRSSDLDDYINGLTNIVGKIHAERVRCAYRPSFEGPVIVEDKESFKKFLEGLMEEFHE